MYQLSYRFQQIFQIMDKILDKEVHQLFKAPSLSTYLTSSHSGKQTNRRQVVQKPVAVHVSTYSPVVIDSSSASGTDQHIPATASQAQSFVLPGACSTVSLNAAGDIHVSGVFVLIDTHANLYFEVQY